MKTHATIAMLLLFTTHCSSNGAVEKKRVDEVMFMTKSNIQGHKSLHEEGMLIVMATPDVEKKVRYHGTTAIAETWGGDSDSYRQYHEALNRNLRNATASSSAFRDEVVTFADDAGGGLRTASHELGQNLRSASKGMVIEQGTAIAKNIAHLPEVYEKRGYKILSTPLRHSEDWYETTKQVHDTIGKTMDAKFIEAPWQTGWDDGIQSFRKARQNAAAADNSILALVHLWPGYLAGLTKMTVKPLAETTWNSGVAVTQLVAKTVTAASLLVKGVVYSAAEVTYHTGSAVAKTLEPILVNVPLMSLGIASYATSPLMDIGGFALSIPLQGAGYAFGYSGYVATSVVGYGLCLGRYGVETTVTTAKAAAISMGHGLYAGGLLAYHMATYPTAHLIYGVGDITTALAIDVPNLAYHVASNSIRWEWQND